MIETGGQNIMFYYPTSYLQNLALLYSTNAVKDVDPFDPLTLTPDEVWFFRESLLRQLTKVWELTFRLTFGVPNANFLCKVIILSAIYDPPPGPGGGTNNTDAGNTVEASGFTVRKAVYSNGVPVANYNALTVINSFVEAVMVYGILSDWYFNKQQADAGKYYSTLAAAAIRDLKNNLFELYKLPI